MSLLITGSTGFLGNNFLHILQKNEYSHSIYLLIRDKKNQNAMERFLEMKNVFHKLNLHLIDIDLLQICSLDLKVDFIIHCAASISFDLDLQEAVKQNVDNVIEIIKFANRNKIPNIIHVSTAFVCEHGRPVKESFVSFKFLGNPIELYEKIKSGETTFSKIINKKFFPNTYCFTKCLAEKIIENEIKKNKSKIKFTIIRPSIITNALKLPYPGWFRGFNTTIGIHKLIVSGIMDVIVLNKHLVLDYVPVDLVSKNIYESIYTNPKKYKINMVTSHLQITSEHFSLFKKYNPRFEFVENDSFMYYFSKYQKLFQMFMVGLYFYFFSFLDKKYMNKYQKTFQYMNIFNNTQKTFYYFYNYPHSFSKNKIQFDEEYFLLMNDSIKNFQHI